MEVPVSFELSFLFCFNLFVLSSDATERQEVKYTSLFKNTWYELKYLQLRFYWTVEW